MNAVRTDRLDAARYPAVANHLRLAAEHYRNLVTCTTSHPELFDTFAPSVRNLVQAKYEEMAVALEAMASTAQEFADQARERLGVTG